MRHPPTTPPAPRQSLCRLSGCVVCPVCPQGAHSGAWEPLRQRSAAPGDMSFEAPCGFQMPGARRPRPRGGTQAGETRPAPPARSQVFPAPLGHLVGEDGHDPPPPCPCQGDQGQQWGSLNVDGGRRRSHRSTVQPDSLTFTQQQQFCTKLNTEQPCDPVIPLLGLCPRELGSGTPPPPVTAPRVMLSRRGSTRCPSRRVGTHTVRSVHTRDTTRPRGGRDLDTFPA